MKMIWMMALAAGSTFAQTTTTPAAKTATAPSMQSNAKSVKTRKPGKPTAVLTIPQTAVDQGDGSFRYLDPKGVAWIYRSTPFGVSRSLESATSAAPAGQTPFGPSKGQAAAAPAVAHAEVKPGTQDDPDAKVTAVAKGDTIEFTRPTPFGITKWQKNKNALTPAEQKIWARLQPKGTE